MADLMRARNAELDAVADVPDNDYYRGLGWVKVDPDTPTAVEAARTAEAEAFHQAQVESGAVFDPASHKADEVVAKLADPELAPSERDQIIAAEREGKARKSVLNES